MIADVLESIVNVLIDDGIRVVGLAVLKVITFGRYKSAGPSSLLVEGGVGLLAIAAALAAVVKLVW